MEDVITNDILNSYNKNLTQNEPTEMPSSYYQATAEAEPKYITAQNGVQFNPDAPPEKKDVHTIEPPKVSIQHF